MNTKIFRPLPFRHMIAGAALLMALLLAACGGNTGRTDNHMHDASTPGAAANAADGQEIDIALTDFKVASSQTSFVVGKPYRFVITNASKTPHELAIAPPMDPGHMMSDAEMHMASLVHVDADQLPTGTAKTVTYIFTSPATAGQLEFGCHIAGHYDAGMHTPITVTQA